LIEFLAGPKYYGNRNEVIMLCGALLPQLYSDYVGNVLTAAERSNRQKELWNKLKAKANAILGVDPEMKK
jgi:hypothetical protein